LDLTGSLLPKIGLGCEGKDVAQGIEMSENEHNTNITHLEINPSINQSI
jgi:hypothetical protein